MHDNTLDILLKDLCDREEGPLTQQEIADYVGCTRERISQIESGAKEKIFDALKECLRDSYNFDILSGLDKG